MSKLTTLSRRLGLAPGIRVRAIFTRRVELEALLSTRPPNFLYTSGRANRYNPAGVSCVYFSDEEDTSRAEYERLWAGLTGEKQPVTTFFARVDLHNVLDLTDPNCLKILKLSPTDLSVDWRRAVQPTETQLLGLAVSSGYRFSAIRYRSDAATVAGKPGINLVIFRDQVHRPDYVRILGPKRRPLQTWP